MARDDYHAIIYTVLKYLYECLKKGQTVEVEKLSAGYLNINLRFWYYIFEHLKEQAYVTGYQLRQTKDGLIFSGLEEIMITPAGIDYLFDNHLLQKAKRVLKDVKDIVPFI